MKFCALSLLVCSFSLSAQDPTVLTNVDEAFRLAGVRSMVDSLPSHINEMTVAAVAQLPTDRRRALEPLIRDMSRKFLDPDAFYRQLQSYFAKHYDAAHMNTYLTLQRTPVYRTIVRLEEGAETPAAQASRRRFEANLNSDPPSPKRMTFLQQLDEARKTTDLQVRLVVAIVNAMSDSLGAQMPAPADMEAQNTAFSTKIRPILAGNVLHANLFTYRNSDDADLEDYVGAAQQKDVEWFNRNLGEAILAVAIDRTKRAAEAIKKNIAKPLLN